MTKSYTHTEKSAEFKTVEEFISKSYAEMPKDYVLDYISVERMYDEPDKYFVSFAARTPHPEFDEV